MSSSPAARHTTREEPQPHDPVLDKVICVACNKPMGNTDACTDDGYPYVIDGAVQWLSAIPYGDPREHWEEAGVTPPEHCHDCGVTVGNPHHWGCDVAHCPNCDQQLLGCGCDMRSEHELRTVS